MEDYRAFVLSRSGPSAAAAAVMPETPPNSCNVVSSSMKPTPVSSSVEHPSWMFREKKKHCHV